MTIKLEVGKSYKTRGGEKATVVGYGGIDKHHGEVFVVQHKGYKLTHKLCGHWCYRDIFDVDDIIAEWEEPMDLTKIEKPFGLLDKDTQERLKAHGGPYQFYHGHGWNDDDSFDGNFHYWVWRVKPQPTVEYKKVVVMSSATGFQYTITEKFVDGKYDSYTVDMVPF